MGNNHLTYFKIENFKKFDSLEVNDIGQFNLIVGDNNVGKTCLLEALLVDEEPQQLLNNFYIGLTKRGLKFQIEEITKKVGNISTTELIQPKENYFKNNIIKEKQKNSSFYINNSSYEENEIHLSILNSISLASYNLNKDKNDFIINKYGYEINIKENLNQFIDIYIKKIKKTTNPLWIYNYDENILNFPLISFNDSPFEQESRSIYENINTKRDKHILIDILKVVNSKIVDIELRENYNDLKSVFLISFADKDEFIPLNFLGDGFKRVFYIILKTISLKGKRILIDEIEIGLHHSKLKDFWVNILKICNELNVQLFATTHSKECAEAFVEAGKNLDINSQNELRLIELYQSKEIVYSGTITGIDNIEYSVKNLPFRGENIYG